MLTLPASTRVFLKREPVDPLSGALFAFLNRSGDRVELLQREGNELWLHDKRLEKGTFRAPSTSSTSAITRAELAMLLDGIVLKKGRFVRRFSDTLRIERRDGDGDANPQTPRRFDVAAQVGARA